MRDIKFRAWNERDKEMVYFDFYEVDEGCCFAGEYIIYDLDKVPIMQYTGLKDSKNKEEYFDDLVRESDGTIRQIKDDCSAVLFEDSKTGDIKYFWELSSHKVIRNIYENPGLLKGEK